MRLDQFKVWNRVEPQIHERLRIHPVITVIFKFAPHVQLSTTWIKAKYGKIITSLKSLTPLSLVL